MAEKPSRSSQPSFGSSAPQLSLPKGGGAIRGIGEKFAANPVTGTGSLSVPIYTSPGRGGFGPQLSLNYDSGSGNSGFGFGWLLSLPAITRKTDKGLPQYGDDTDTFLLSGAEDLVPWLQKQGDDWVRVVAGPRVVYGNSYLIHSYRPRMEGLFARIERWANASDPKDTFWRSISKDNVTTWYGKTEKSRIADPEDASRIFTWLICESYDDKGNVISYDYKAEDDEGVDLSQACEQNRTPEARAANRYIKNIFYGNRTPYLPDLNARAPTKLPDDWCFQLVFDYGEHDPAVPTTKDNEHAKWPYRADAFSTYRPTFEVRTQRLCRRALMFHHFPNTKDASGVDIGRDCLVRSTDIKHAEAGNNDPTQPFYSYVVSIQQTGYTRNGRGGYTSTSLPPLEFEYTSAEIDETVRDLDEESLKNLPTGIGGQYRWVDLDGEGVSGILTEQGGTWFYKPNLSPMHTEGGPGEELTVARLGAVALLKSQPSPAALSGGRQQLMDLSGDGQLDLVEFDRPVPGFFERTTDEDWNPFQAFSSVPAVDWHDPNLRFVDLTGDGFPDLLITEDDALVWHASLAVDGFGPEQRVAKALDEESGPRVVFSDGTETIFVADMSGDGLADLVRVRNGEVCYWPNRGFGSFGAKVSMDNAPRFETDEAFVGRRVHLADIDGSGTADIVYFAADGVQLYFNQSGNAWGDVYELDHFPQVDSIASAMTLDLLGIGTACLVWSSSLPGDTARPLRYIRLMGHKPHLLTRVRNNFGAETVVSYAASTKFYLKDKIAGTPWVTRVPFPVHVVEKVETYDYISRNRFSSTYSYHHGYYDGVEREFRGFGRVDQRDTEELSALGDGSQFPQPSNEDDSSNVPPVVTKTWFHTGVFAHRLAISRHMAQEYWTRFDATRQLDDTGLPTTIFHEDATRSDYDLTPEEMREACRALRGSILRQEIYAEDGTADLPFSVSERNYTIELLQPQGPNRYAVFLTHARESVDFHYERKVYEIAVDTTVDPARNVAHTRMMTDPRVSHALTLAVDGFGNVLQSVAIGYGRRYRDYALTDADRNRQMTTLLTCSENIFTQPVDDADNHRTPLPAESSSYELLQVKPKTTDSEVTYLFGFDDIVADAKTAADGNHDVTFENIEGLNLKPGEPYRRLLQRVRTLYRPDDMGQAAGDRMALLPLKTMESRALPGCSYKLALTPGLVDKVFQRKGGKLFVAKDVLGSTAADGGGYIDLDNDGNWWIPSGRSFYRPDVATPANERAEAQQHFYLARRFEDAYGNPTTADYETPHYLLIATTSDAVGNSSTAVNDYRVLAPSKLKDPNGNRSAVKFDALGMITATAVMGKENEQVGDSLDDVAADLSQQQIDAIYNADVPTDAAKDLLGSATSRVVYDVRRFANSRSAAPGDPTKWKPVWGATIQREAHVSDLALGAKSRLQVSFSYSDGFGREIQRKIQAEPGPVVDKGPTVDPRWVGSGWTIFNNKGNPVRQYEPFFSQLKQGHQFEFAVVVGVSPIVCYDPMDRVVATIHPNHTFEKVVFDPWQQATWDSSDTAKIDDPATDPDVGGHISKIARDDYFPTWHSQRINDGTRPYEQDAAKKTEPHAGTPTIAYFDALGRTFLTIADNGGAEKFPTRLELDIQGNQRAVRDAIVVNNDAQGRIVMRYDYDLLQNRIYQSSIEAGERWMLSDAAGKPIRAWDGRGHNLRTEYDPLRRPTGMFVRGTDNANSDPRTLAVEIQFDKIVYGEGQAPELNLRTRVFQHFDTAGVLTNKAKNPDTNKDEAYDFKGNLLRSTRGIIADHQALPDWSAGPAIDETFATSLQFDALNRKVSLTTADGSVTRPSYNEANLLEAVAVNVRGAQLAATFVANVDYNEKGQRTRIAYGNNVSSSYAYERETFRLENVTTGRAGFPGAQRIVQDLSFTYDPAGNITYIVDDAQDTIFFNNQKIEPSADFAYDAIYRLIKASGREQLGLGGDEKPLAPQATSYNDVPRAALPHPGDGKAMGTYTEKYTYDAVGNFMSFVHRGSNPANPGWTRTYTYTEASLLEVGKYSNRLTSTTILGNQPVQENYAYDAHGNMTSMPQLQQMQWNFKDELLMTQRQAVNNNDDDGKQHRGQRTYYVYDAAGQRVRKVTESAAGKKIKERIYLGLLEYYREFDTNGQVTLARETLHVMDERRRVALVETKARDANVATGLPSTTVRYQLENHLGTATLELDENSAVITYEEFYPYGSTSYQAGRSAAEVSLKRYRYTGKEKDEESGLYYHGARYYAAWIGRWTNCDQAGIKDGVNRYLYVHANPARKVDPTGTQSAETGQMSPEVRAAWDAAEKTNYDEASVNALVAAQDADFEKRGVSLATRQALLERATVRATVASRYWDKGEYGVAVAQGTAGVIESLGIGYGMFGDSKKGTAVRMVIAAAIPSVARRLLRGLGGLAYRGFRGTPEPPIEAPPAKTKVELPEQKATPEVPLPKPAMTDEGLIARANQLFKEIASAYLKSKGKIPTEGAINSLKKQVTVGVLQKSVGGQNVVMVAVNNPEFAPFLKSAAAPGEVFVEPIEAVRISAKTAAPLKTGGINVHAEQVLAAEQVKLGPGPARVATSNAGCQALCVSHLNDAYPEVTHVNPSGKKP